MATHDYIISNASGAAVRADLNNALAAIATNNSSATAPTTTYAYQWWADTGSSPTVMKLRNAANSAWITLFQLDGEWSLIPFENGTAAAPSIYFKDSGTDTGIFSPGTDQVGITTGGSVRLTTSTTAFTGTLPWQGQNGTAAAPALSFSGDPNTGIYNVGADQLGISTNGTLRFDVSTTATTSTLPVVHPLGAVGTPSITFTGDLNTGIYSPAADTIAFVEGGAEAARIDSSSRLLVGTSTSPSSGFGQYARLVVQGQPADATGGGNFSIQRGEAAAGGNITSGEGIGNISWNDNAGNTFGLIGCEADANAGTNDYPGRLVFSTTADGASSPTERVRITNDGYLLVGTTNKAPRDISGTTTGSGVALDNGAGGFIQVAGNGTLAFFNRVVSDGTLIQFRQDGADEGSISVSGTTVSYNGAHLSRWSQLPGGAERTEILRGTVLSNIDEMCTWGEEENEQLNRMKVSDVEGDPNVAGVFQAWDDDDDTYTDDFYCAMTGDFIIRIAEGVTVQRGDLLMSAGDGTAKPQDDDIIRSKTVAKVTSTHVTCTYEDGSYCVPCVLMAC